MLNWFNVLIDADFGYQISLDDLPAALKLEKDSQFIYGAPIPLGLKDTEGNYFVYNHLHFSVQTTDIDGGFNIVGFSVQPMSIDHTEMDRQQNALASKIASASSV